MPGLNGFEVLQIVRSEFPHLEVLVVSGYLEGEPAVPLLLVESARQIAGRFRWNKNAARPIVLNRPVSAIGSSVIMQNSSRM